MFVEASDSGRFVEKRLCCEVQNSAVAMFIEHRFPHRSSYIQALYAVMGYFPNRDYVCDGRVGLSDIQRSEGLQQ
jgi:hypothetical protein